MPFDHHRLDAYRGALEALDACDAILKHLPRGRASLRDQLDRSITSVVANIAEGAGEYMPREKARFYRMARRSAIESAAWIEIAQRRHEVPEQQTHAAMKQLERVVGMLVGLITRCERVSNGRDVF